MKTALHKLITEEIVRILSDVGLQEGGLGGHMYHLYDNPNMSFSEMKEVFRMATEGKLEGVQEKLDGQNVFLTYNVAEGQVKFARNKGNIKTGGMTGEDVLAKWENIPTVRDAYFNAYQVLTKGFEAVSDDGLRKIFGDNGNVWYSAEVVYSGNPNVINYDRDALVFHEPGTETIYDEDGKPMDVDTSHHYAALSSVLSKVQSSITKSSWSVLGPIVMNMAKATRGDAGAEASSLLDAELGKYGLGDGDTIRDYVATKFAKEAMGDVNVPEEQKQAVGEIFASDESPGTKKKAAVALTGNKELNNLFLAKNQNLIKKSIVKPLEEIVHQFAVDVLDGVHSVLAMHPDKEVRRLQQVVGAEIEKIRASGDEKAMGMLQKQLGKLRGVDQITSSLEGVLFKYKGNTYKLTGNFAPVNQLLGLLRFSR